MLDFSLSPSQKAVRDNARLFATTHLTTARATYSTCSSPVDRFRATQPLYAKATELGLIKGQVPVQLGGLGGSLIEAALCIEELYAVEASTSLTILATGLGLTPLILAGSKEHHKKFLKPFLEMSGTPIASLVHSEPTGTANFAEKGASGPQTTARKEGDEWVINGEKLWATNCAGWDDRGADIQCVTCRCIDDTPSANSSEGPASQIMMIIVGRSDIAANPASSYEVLNHPETIGHTAVVGPHIRFNNLRVPATNVLAPPGKGIHLAEAAFTMSAALVGAMSVGLMRRTFEAALAFAKKDNRSGSVPIIQKQSVADILMSIKMRCEASRALTWKACCSLEGENGPAAAEIAYEAKVFCSDNAVQAVIEGMNAVGVTSYGSSQPFGELLNDTVCLPLFDGGNVGIRRRQIERMMIHPDYEPWAATFGPEKSVVTGQEKS